MDRGEVGRLAFEEAEGHVEETAAILRGEADRAAVLRPGDRPNGAGHREPLRKRPVLCAGGIGDRTRGDVEPHAPDIQLAVQIEPVDAVAEVGGAGAGRKRHCAAEAGRGERHLAGCRRQVVGQGDRRVRRGGIDRRGERDVDPGAVAEVHVGERPRRRSQVLGERPALRREVDGGASANREPARHVITVRVAGAEARGRLTRHQGDMPRAAVGNRELVAEVGDGGRIDSEAAGRVGERHVDELRVVQRDGGAGGRLHVLREGPAARDEGERDVAGAERAGGPVPVRIRGAQSRRRLAGVELQAPEPRPAQREFGLEVGDRCRVDRVAGRCQWRA